MSTFAEMQAKMQAAIDKASAEAQATIDNKMTQAQCRTNMANTPMGSSTPCDSWRGMRTATDHVGGFTSYNGGAFSHQGLISRGQGYEFNKHLPNPGQPSENTTYPLIGDKVGYETFPNWNRFKWVSMYQGDCSPTWGSGREATESKINWARTETWKHVKQGKIPGIQWHSKWTGLSMDDAEIGWNHGNWRSQYSNIHKSKHGCGKKRNFLYALDAGDSCRRIGGQGIMEPSSVKDAFENKWATGTTQEIKGTEKINTTAEKLWNVGSATCMYPKDTLKTANDIIRYDDLANQNLIAKHDTVFGQTLFFNAACDVRMEHGVNGTECPLNNLTNKRNSHCSLIFGDKANKATELCRLHWLAPRMVANPNTENNLKEAYCEANPGDDACSCITAVKKGMLLCDKKLMDASPTLDRDMYNNDSLKMKGYCDFLAAQSFIPPPRCWFKPCQSGNTDFATLKTSANDYDQDAIITDQSCGDLCFNMININLQNAEINASVDLQFAPQDVACSTTNPSGYDDEGDDDLPPTVDETDVNIDTGDDENIVIDLDDGASLNINPGDASSGNDGGIAGFSNNNILMIVGVIVAIIILGGAGYMLFGRKSKSTSTITPSTTTTTVTKPVAAPKTVTKPVVVKPTPTMV